MADASHSCNLCRKPAAHRCGKCQQIWYCGRECQSADWKGGHRDRCRLLAQQRLKAHQASIRNGDPAPVIPTNPPFLFSRTTASTGSSLSSVAATQRDTSLTLPPPPSLDASTQPLPARMLMTTDEFVKGWKFANASYCTPAVPALTTTETESFRTTTTAQGQPRGIVNLGNTCYASVVLQALLATKPLMGSLLWSESGHLSKCGRRKNGQWCPVCELMSFAMQALVLGDSIKHPTASTSSSDCERVDRDHFQVAHTRQPLNPATLLRGIRLHGHLISRFRQEDSHELFVSLLENVEAVLLQQSTASVASLDAYSRGTTAVGHAFACVIRSQVDCLSCGAVSKRYGVEAGGLILSIPDGSVALEALIKQNYFEEERLQGDCRYSCDACRHKVDAIKSGCIEIAPNVLLLCLKRAGEGVYGKRKSTVTFPEQLDMSPWIPFDALDDDSPATYRLYCVVQHVDRFASTHCGHYVCYVRRHGSWYLCDDELVEKVDEQEVFKAEPFLLFYERQVPRAALPLRRSSDGNGKAHAADLCDDMAEMLSDSDESTDTVDIGEHIDEMRTYPRDDAHEAAQDEERSSSPPSTAAMNAAVCDSRSTASASADAREGGALQYGAARHDDDNQAAHATPTISVGTVFGDGGRERKEKHRSSDKTKTRSASTAIGIASLKSTSARASVRPSAGVISLAETKPLPIANWSPRGTPALFEGNSRTSEDGLKTFEIKVQLPEISDVESIQWDVVECRGTKGRAVLRVQTEDGRLWCRLPVPVPVEVPPLRVEWHEGSGALVVAFEVQRPWMDSSTRGS